MAASLLIEEESGTYSGRIRHPHNGYYAGDFSQSPRAWQWWRTDGANPSIDQPAGYVATSSATPIPTT